jgi:predicted metalloprotease
MKWEGGEESANVEDRRGEDDGGGGGGGGFGAPHMIFGTGGTVLILIIGYFMGFDPSRILQLLQTGQNQQPPTQQRQSLPAGAGTHDRAHKFIATILGETEAVWDEQFRKMGKTYTHPKTVIYSGSISTGCGPGTAAMGPFYCPADQKVYIDPTFYDELQDRLGGSKADFSNAYVLAHEIGHHVQNLLGFSEIVDEKRRQLSPAEFNKWSVRLELQADYLAGVWAHYGQEKFHFVENGDVEEAVKSAYAIGDDTLQSRAGRHISPQNFTHGTSAQRVKWYKKGFDTGDMSQLKTLFDIPYDQL